MSDNGNSEVLVHEIFDQDAGLDPMQQRFNDYVGQPDNRPDRLRQFGDVLRTTGRTIKVAAFAGAVILGANQVAGIVNSVKGWKLPYVSMEKPKEIVRTITVPAPSHVEVAVLPETVHITEEIQLDCEAAGGIDVAVKGEKSWKLGILGSLVVDKVIPMKYRICRDNEGVKNTLDVTRNTKTGKAEAITVTFPSFTMLDPHVDLYSDKLAAPLRVKDTASQRAAKLAEYRKKKAAHKDAPDSGFKVDGALAPEGTSQLFWDTQRAATTALMLDTSVQPQLDIYNTRYAKLLPKKLRALSQYASVPLDKITVIKPEATQVDWETLKEDYLSYYNLKKCSVKTDKKTGGTSITLVQYDKSTFNFGVSRDAGKRLQEMIDGAKLEEKAAKDRAKAEKERKKTAEKAAKRG